MSAYKILTGESCFSWEYVRRLLKGYHSYCQVVSNVNSAFHAQRLFFKSSNWQLGDDLLPQLHLKGRKKNCTQRFSGMLCIFVDMISQKVEPFLCSEIT